MPADSRRVNAPSFWQGPAGLTDMLAAALRGSTKQAIGFPGDMESLGRLGLNKIGANVSPETALPTTEDMDRHLPPFTPISDTSAQSWKPMETMGEMIPAPTVLSAAPKAMALASKLRKPAEAAQFADTVPDASRRGFLKQASGAALGAAAPGLALKSVAPEAAAAAEGAPALAAALRAGGATAAKGAFRAWTPALAANLLKNKAVLWGIDDLKPAHITEDAIKRLNELGITPEQAHLYDSWATKVKPWETPLPEVQALKDEGMAKFHAATKEHPNYEAMDPHYGMSQKEYYDLMEKHQYLTPEEKRARAAQGIIRDSDPATIKKAMMSGKLPEEWAKKGVQESDFANHLFPEHPRWMRTDPSKLDEVDKLQYSLDDVMSNIAYESQAK